MKIEDSLLVTLASAASLVMFSPAPTMTVIKPVVAAATAAAAPTATAT